ncbi:MAG: hypothetical protein AB1324_07485 [Candidatus Micrarchaeota archaeon]
MGKKKASGSATKTGRSASPAETVRSGSGLRAAWDSALGLFDPGKAGARIRAAAADGNRDLGIAVFAIGSLIIFLFGVASTYESIQVTNFASDTFSEVVGAPQPKLDISLLGPAALHQFLFWVVFVFALNLAAQAASFGLARLTGGTGTFAQHIYAGSVVWLAVSVSLVATLFAPLTPILPCIALLAVVSVWIISFMYLMLYMNARALEAVHGLSMIHSLTITILIAAPWLAAWYFALTTLAAMLGIGASVGV